MSPTPLPDLVAELKPSIATVLVYTQSDDEPSSQGTGWFVAAGQIVTNRHVILGARRAEINLSTGTVVPVIGVLADDESHDLVILSVDVKDGPHPLPLAVRQPREGDRVFVIGSPCKLEYTVSEGIISSIRDTSYVGMVLQTTAAISPGSSGSPVFNMEGAVVGVATYSVVGGQSLNFAVISESVSALEPGISRTLGEWSADSQQSGKRGLTYQACISTILEEKFKSAWDRFIQAAEGESLDSAAWISIGHVQGRPISWEDVVQAAERAIRGKPDNAKAHFVLGLAYNRLSRWEDAVHAFKQLVLDNPYAVNALCLLGAAYCKLDRWDDAVRTFEQIPRFNQKPTETPYVLAMAYGKIGRWEDAIRTFNHVIRVNPDDAIARFILGMTYDRLGRRREAYKTYKQAIHVNWSHAEAHFGLGLNYLMGADVGAAIEEYKTLKQLDPQLANRLFEFIYP